MYTISDVTLSIAAIASASVLWLTLLWQWDSIPKVYLRLRLRFAIPQGLPLACVELRSSPRGSQTMPSFIILVPNSGPPIFMDD